MIQSKATHLIWPKFLKVPCMDVVDRIKSHIKPEDFSEANFTYEHKRNYFIKSVKSGHEKNKNKNSSFKIDSVDNHNLNNELNEKFDK